MKKLFSLVLVVALVLAMAITASAAQTTPQTVTTNGGSTTAYDVKAQYVEGDKAPDTYAVDVAFGAMTFTYSRAAKSWNTAEHIEEDDGAATWAPTSADAAKITVTNHSNVAITATAAWADDATITTVDAEFTNNGLQLAAAAGQTAPSGFITVALKGELANTVTTSTTVGTVTVTIAKYVSET